jgi:AP-3 complex subunit sigma
MFCLYFLQSGLGILGLIQGLVEAFDRCFENVCELDLILHGVKVHCVLAWGDGIGESHG